MDQLTIYYEIYIYNEIGNCIVSDTYYIDPNLSYEENYKIAESIAEEICDQYADSDWYEIYER